MFHQCSVFSGGTVRSSFKPSDNAKLYASPENVQSVGFRAQAEDDSPTRNATAALKKRSPTRANSMPPRPTRPQVLKRPPAEVPLSVCSPLETYNINGVNYTTHTTFRSPMTPDDPPEDGMHEMVFIDGFNCQFTLIDFDRPICLLDGRIGGFDSHSRKVVGLWPLNSGT